MPPLAQLLAGDTDNWFSVESPGISRTAQGLMGAPLSGKVSSPEPIQFPLRDFSHEISK